MSKLSFRARALDASKPMPIFLSEEIPDLPEYSAINRAVPQMPSGMEKEEECEHHLQRAICTGLIIPTPEVSIIEDAKSYERLYSTCFKMPRQLIHMQPFAMEQDIPDYDMDSEDERFVNAQANKSDLTPFKFEEMMDRLEKGSGQTVVTLSEAKSLLKEDDDLIIAVYDYWLTKRLKTVVPLIPVVKTEHRLGSSANNPYVAFRRRTEKMQTRKNRKNDESSYEKMLKLKRDLSRTVTLLELVKRREKTKRELINLKIEVYEKRYQAQDFSGQLLAEVSAIKTPRPAFAPIFSNQFGYNHQNWLSRVPSIKEDTMLPRKEKRQYKRRKHKTSVSSSLSRGGYLMSNFNNLQNSMVSSEEEIELVHPEFTDITQLHSEGMFTFKRKQGCSYFRPTTNGLENVPWCGNDLNRGDPRHKLHQTALTTPRMRKIGYTRRRMGRGGRVILDRFSSPTDEFWSSMGYDIKDSMKNKSIVKKEENKSTELLFKPKTSQGSEDTLDTDIEYNGLESLPNTLIVDVEFKGGCDIHSFIKSKPLVGNIEVYKRRKTRKPTPRYIVKEEVSHIPLNDIYTFEDDLEVVDNRTRDKFRSGKVKKVIKTEDGNDGDNDDDDDDAYDRETEIGEGCVGNSLLSETKFIKSEVNISNIDTQRNDFSLNSISDLNDPDKLIFRRNYRIGGFKDIHRRTKSSKPKDPNLSQTAAAKYEISLPEIFAGSSILQEHELEAADDSFAILDKLGLDDEFIRKEPEISLDVESQAKTDTGQNLTDNNSITYQKQRLKKEKNIFDFSENDFLKYETEGEVDDLVSDMLQFDVVGMSSLFGLTPNSRFNIINPKYLPLESEKLDTETAESTDIVTKTKPPDDKNVTFGEIAKVSSEVVSQPLTIPPNNLRSNVVTSGTTSSVTTSNILASRLNLKTDFPTYQFPTATNVKIASHVSTVQSSVDIYALNHHNYTISGPPSYNIKQNSLDNTQQKLVSKTVDSEVGKSTLQRIPSSPSYVTQSQGLASILSGQILKTTGQMNSQKTNRVSTATLGYTKLTALSGAHITQNLGHTTINHDPSGTSLIRTQRDNKLNVNTITDGAEVAARTQNHKEIIRTTVNNDGAGIVRTYRSGLGSFQLNSDGSIIVQDVSKRPVTSNGPASSDCRRLLRAAPQSTMSSQNPTITQLVTGSNVFTIDGSNFVTRNQKLSDHNFVTSNQNVNFITTSQSGVNFVTSNNDFFISNQVKQIAVPQQKVSLLFNPSDTKQSAPQEAVGMDIANDSVETIDIETSECEVNDQAKSSNLKSDNKKQINVRKNNSLPMEVV